MHFFLGDPVAYSPDMKIALAWMAALCIPGVLAAQNSASASLLALAAFVPGQKSGLLCR
jgi:hypothetical protein